jgi:hypothetical protein
MRSKETFSYVVHDVLCSSHATQTDVIATCLDFLSKRAPDVCMRFSTFANRVNG